MSFSNGSKNNQLSDMMGFFLKKSTLLQIKFYIIVLISPHALPYRSTTVVTVYFFLFLQLQNLTHPLL